VALSPSHQFGQMIGGVFETAVRALLEEVAAKHGLYLDQRGHRACRPGRKCTWVDARGNAHDLDFVFERGGSLDRVGQPIAFIEAAWRRYTKHSRNKVQEIQGAVLPLVETYHHLSPFRGAILAGVFTDGALTQLSSHGFAILHFPYEAVTQAFARFDVDATYDEDTRDVEFRKKIRAYRRISRTDRKRLAQEVLDSDHEGVAGFVASLESAISPRIERIVVLPLHGKRFELATVASAIEHIESYTEGPSAAPFERYEIQIRYSNGDTVEGRFGTKAAAVEFLRQY